MSAVFCIRWRRRRRSKNVREAHALATRPALRAAHAARSACNAHARSRPPSAMRPATTAAAFSYHVAQSAQHAAPFLLAGLSAAGPRQTSRRRVRCVRVKVRAPRHADPERPLDPLQMHPVPQPALQPALLPLLPGCGHSVRAGHLPLRVCGSTRPRRRGSATRCCRGSERPRARSTASSSI